MTQMIKLVWKEQQLHQVWLGEYVHYLIRFENNGTANAKIL